MAWFMSYVQRVNGINVYEHMITTDHPLDAIWNMNSVIINDPDEGDCVLLWFAEVPKDVFDQMTERYGDVTEEAPVSTANPFPEGVT